MNMNKKRIISFLLTFTIAVGMISYAFAEENATEDNGNDPYVNMVSLTDEAETPATSIDEMLSEEEQQLENDRIARKEAAKKTDRYLVKYKSESGENKVGKKLKHKVKEKKEVKGKKEKKSKKTDLIILNEPIEPEQFAEELRAMNIEDSIEYIQPDFRLNPSSVSLEVTLVGDSESNESPKNSQMTEDGTPQSEDSESIESSNSSDASEQTVEEIPPQNTEQGSGATEEPADSSPEETVDTSKEENTQPEEGSQEPSDAQPEENLQEPEELPTDQNSPVLVAVIDTGVDISHELIRDYLWSNEDQINGWNFIDENGEVFDTDAPWQDLHGTQVAGIIAQVAQNNQIPLQIITCKVFENGTAYTSDVIEAIEFAQEKGAKVINMSFGGGFYNPALYDTMRDSNMLFITAAGNNRANLDETPVYPACFDLSNIVSVSSTNADGGFSFFSNYSTTQVDVTARGRDVVSALPGNQSGKFTGTSMSAAYVSGVAMAVYSQNAEMTKEQVKERILETSNRFDNLQDKVSRGRNINLQQALAGQIVSDVTHVNPADDFDVTSYRPTVNEQLTLFGSKQAVAGAVGVNHYLILMDDGTVWSFGGNEHGQLGSGEDEYAWHPYSQPVQVVGLSNIIKIAAGDHFSLALSADGTLWEWDRL